MSNLLLKGQPIGKVKGILFDKDGTLSNSEENLLKLTQLRINQVSTLIDSHNGINKKSNIKLKQLLSTSYGITPKGIKPDKILAVASRNDNLIATATIISLLEESWPNAINIATEAFDKADKLYLERQDRQLTSPVLPGFISFFKELRKKNIICSLISNDNTHGIKNFLNNNNLDKGISHFWSCENKPVKPNPLAVHALCKLIKLNPEDCALIGDSDSDLLMAQQAGIPIVLGYSGGWKIPPILTYQDHLFHNWEELSID